tara:strand:+ start:280 stop:612 length:333 start_codon:yes stop_codon:yes gene_type:complete
VEGKEMPLWFIAILIWIVAGSTISFFTRRSMAKYYIQALQIRDEESDTDPYQRGFKDGAMGIKMYYTILEKMPDSHWVLTNCMKKLDTREKILETLTEAEKNAIYESSSA